MLARATPVAPPRRRPVLVSPALQEWSGRLTIILEIWSDHLDQTTSAHHQIGSRMSQAALPFAQCRNSIDSWRRRARGAATDALVPISTASSANHEDGRTLSSGT